MGAIFRAVFVGPDRAKGVRMDDARDIVGRTIMVQLSSHDGLEFTGIPDQGPFFCKAVAVDEAGVWVENRNFVTIELTDSEGRDIPKSKQRPEKHVVNILLPWRNIRTVVHFPEKDAGDLAGDMLGEKKEKTIRVGFVT
jgi:hypothetical protein